MKKILPSVFALLFSAGLILFSAWYLLFFESGKLYKTSSGFPYVHELKTFSLDTATTDLGYKIKLNSNDTVFVLRMYGESFSLSELDKKLSADAEIRIVYHPMPNEHREFEVYTIEQNGKFIYKFNKNFNPNSSKTFGWITLIAGSLFFLLGFLSLRKRMKS